MKWNKTTRFLPHALTLLALAGCGGGGGGGSDAPPPAVDQKPTANAGADQTLTERGSLTLTGSAVDDKTGAQFSWTQISGPTLALASANSLTPSVTAPSLDAEATAVLRLTVTDSSGQSASDELTLALKTIKIGLTLTGQAVDRPLANAAITASVDGQTINATADANGNYSLALSVDDSRTDALVTLTATGTGTQSALRFTSIAGTMGQLQKVAGSDLSVNVAEAPSVNITNVTTARAVLLQDANTGRPITDLAQLTVAERHIEPNALMEIAAVIKLVADDARFTLPAGFADVASFVKDKTAYNAFLETQKTQAPTALAETIAQILADPALTPPPVESATPSLYYHTDAAAPGFLSRDGESFSFKPDHSGSRLHARGRWDYTWSLANGRYTLSYNQPQTSEFPYVNSELLTELGLTPEQVTHVLGHLVGPQIEVITKPLATVLQKVSDGAVTDTFRVTERTTRQLAPITLSTGEIISGPEVASDATSDALMHDGDALKPIPLTPAEMTSTWALNTFYSLKTAPSGRDPYTETNYFLDRLQFNANGIGNALQSGRSFAWTLSQGGTLTIAFSDGTLQETKLLDELNGQYGVFTTTRRENEVTSAEYSWAVKVDPEASFAGNLHVNGPNEYWQSFSGAWMPLYWSKGHLILGDENDSSLLGFRFDVAGTGFRPSLIGGWQFEGQNFIPSTFDSMAWTVEADGSLKNAFTTISRCGTPRQSCRYRSWKLLKKVPGTVGTERIFVMDDDWRTATPEGPYIRRFGTRLNQYERLSFDYWDGMGPTKPQRKIEGTATRHVLVPASAPTTEQ